MGFFHITRGVMDRYQGLRSSRWVYRIHPAVLGSLFPGFPPQLFQGIGQGAWVLSLCGRVGSLDALGL